MGRLVSALAPLLLLGDALAQGFLVRSDLLQAYELAPGEEATGEVVLFNPGGDALEVGVELADYSETMGFQPLGTLPRSLGRDLYLLTQTVVLPPGGEVRLPYRVRAPEGLEGTRYAAILLTPKAHAGGEGEGRGEVTAGVRVVQRYAILVTVSHGGEVNLRFLPSRKEGEVLVFSIQNVGSRFYRPQVRHRFLLLPEGQVWESPPQTYTFFPGEEKRIRVPLRGLPPGDYQVFLFLDDGVYARAARVSLTLP